MVYAINIKRCFLATWNQDGMSTDAIEGEPSHLEFKDGMSSLEYVHTSFKLTMELSLRVLIVLPKTFKLSMVLRLKCLPESN